MNIMNHFRMSDLTTPRELTDANLDDLEKLELGLGIPNDLLLQCRAHGLHERRLRPRHAREPGEPG